MVSIRKRAAGIGVAVAMIAAAGSIGVAGASAATPLLGPGPLVPRPVAPGPISGAYQAGADAAIGGWNAGADAAVGGFNAGAAALGLPFQYSVQTYGPLGLHRAGIAPLMATR
jgi:hypothetical protein